MTHNGGAEHDSGRRVPVVEPEVLRQATLQMADWLEGLEFGATVDGSVSHETAEQLVEAWTAGFCEAIRQLRIVATPPLDVPDDLSELDS